VSAIPQVQPPDAPADLSATAVSESQILLSWTNGPTPASTFTVQRSPQNAGTWTTVTSSLAGGASSYLDGGLAPSTGYDYRVQGTNTGGASVFTIASAATPAGIGDGIPGSWRYQYFGNGLTLTAASALNADGDADGMSNQQEYLAGTDPTNGVSVLAISSLGPVGNDIQLSFPSVSGKTYTVEKSDTLGSAWSLLQDNVPGTGSPVTVTDSGAASLPHRFYHVKIKP
jgi:hypothetical protein